MLLEIMLKVIYWIVNDDFLISSSIEITEIGPFLSTTIFT